jgi:hypothetical protein
LNVYLKYNAIKMRKNYVSISQAGTLKQIGVGGGQLMEDIYINYLRNL